MIVAAESLWSQLRPLNDHVHDEYVNTATLQQMQNLRTSVARTIKALEAVIVDGSPIARADVEARLSTAHRSSDAVARLFPASPLQYVLVDGGRSYLKDELQRLKVLHQSLGGLDRRLWSKERRTAQSFVYIAARLWAAEIRMPSANGRYFKAIHELAQDQAIKALEQDAVRAYLKEWKSLPSTSAYSFQGEISGGV